MGLFDFFRKKDKESSTRPTNTVNISFSMNNTNNDVLSVQDREKITKPTCDGLYPHDVLLISYAENYTNGKNEFHGFWEYKYGIKDVDKLLKRLKKNGYIEDGTIKDALIRKRAADVKALAEKYNLNSKGKKEVIIDCILQNVDGKKLEKELSEKPYVITEKGAEILKKYEYIPYIHRHSNYNIDIYTLNEEMEETKKKTGVYYKYRDVIWGLFNEQLNEAVKNSMFGDYRIINFNMYNFLLEEGRQDAACKILFWIFSDDLSGLDNSFNPKLFYIKYRYYYPYADSLVKVVPFCMEELLKYCDLYQWSDDDLKKQALQYFKKYDMPYSIFTPEEKANILIAEKCKDIKSLEKIYEDSRKRFKKTYKC